MDNLTYIIQTNYDEKIQQITELMKNLTSMKQEIADNNSTFLCEERNTIERVTMTSYWFDTMTVYINIILDLLEMEVDSLLKALEEIAKSNRVTVALYASAMVLVLIGKANHI